MTISTQTLTIFTSANIDMQDMLYNNRLMLAKEIVGVTEIPTDFYIAAVYRDGQGDVLAINFFNEDYSSLRTIDIVEFAAEHDGVEISDVGGVVLRALESHKDAKTVIDAMNFCMVIKDEGCEMEDVDFTDALCVVEVQDIAMAGLETLSPEQRESLQNAMNGGGGVYDSLPKLDKEVTLVAGKDFFQDIVYNGTGTCRMLFVDDILTLDPWCLFTTVEGTPNIHLRLAVTDVAKGVEFLPVCMRT